MQLQAHFYVKVSFDFASLVLLIEQMAEWF
jgi:hypothetical protein